MCEFKRITHHLRKSYTPPRETDESKIKHENNVKQSKRQRKKCHVWSKNKMMKKRDKNFVKNYLKFYTQIFSCLSSHN